MAADVITGQSGHHDTSRKKELFTLDLLGGCDGGISGDEKELWDKKLQLLSRKSSYESDADPIPCELLDLNLPPPPMLTPVISFASVCTLEKVRSALDLQASDANPNASRSPESDGSSSSSAKKRKMDGQDGWGCGYRSGSTMVTVCPGCFQYLLISAVDPTCPKCEAHVPFLLKKPKFDLNCSSS